MESGGYNRCRVGTVRGQEREEAVESGPLVRADVKELGRGEAWCWASTVRPSGRGGAQ